MQHLPPLSHLTYVGVLQSLIPGSIHGLAPRQLVSLCATVTAPVAGLFLRHPKVSRVWTDFENLRERVRRRQDPETLAVLASYWLKSLCVRGYGLAEWRELDGLLRESLRERFADTHEAELFVDIRNWIAQNVLASGHPPQLTVPARPPERASLDRDRLLPYLIRLLNEWVPVEVSRLLVAESTSENEDRGIPPLAVARAIERLLVRERLSPGTLESVLDPHLWNPRHVYPSHAEILRDVVLFLLGRTDPIAAPHLPAALLCIAPGALLPADYQQAAGRAFFASNGAGEELHVPIRTADTLELLKSDHVRIGSVLVTMDGRWWESRNLLSGEQHFVVYRPMGWLRIDFSADHARIRAPWPETCRRWSGEVNFPQKFEIFGREWRIGEWEQDADRAWVNLVFSRPLPAAEAVPAEPAKLRRLPPASVDMAWAALEIALAASVAGNSLEPIEQLRNAELVPLGRALFGLVETVMSRRLRQRDRLETHIRAVRYLEAQVAPSYGLVPWRILPEAARKALLQQNIYSVFSELLEEVFVFPEVFRLARKRPASGEVLSHSSDEAQRAGSPSHAA